MTGGLAPAKYDGDFFREAQASGRLSAEVVVPLLMDWIRPESVVDVGCATGSWLAVFRLAGVRNILGIDGGEVALDQLDIPVESFRRADLAAGLDDIGSFSLALSLEVAEHLPAARAERHVADLVRLAPVVAFSAAIPHQGGTHHVNEQWPDFWSDLFKRWGYIALDCVRPMIWSDAGVAWWYRQNLIVYAGEEALERHRRLREAVRWPGEQPARLVHPERYLEWVEYGITESTIRWA